jgi:hypothetical protein
MVVVSDVRAGFINPFKKKFSTASRHLCSGLARDCPGRLGGRSLQNACNRFGLVRREPLPSNLMCSLRSCSHRLIVSFRSRVHVPPSFRFRSPRQDDIGFCECLDCLGPDGLLPWTHDAKIERSQASGWFHGSNEKDTGRRCQCPQWTKQDCQGTIDTVPYSKYRLCGCCGEDWFD